MAKQPYRFPKPAPGNPYDGLKGIRPKPASVDMIKAIQDIYGGGEINPKAGTITNQGISKGKK